MAARMRSFCYYIFMAHLEKKYRVTSFTKILKKLRELGAVPVSQTSSLHYYAQQEGNNVTKLVHYDAKDEIHILKDDHGKYELVESKRVKDVEEGLDWLKRLGYTTLDKISMSYTEYPYQGGIVGLYVINNELNSVILDFPPEKHARIEKELGLEQAEQIKVPYNKYLQGVNNTKR